MDKVIRLIDTLRQKGKTVSAMESCTGGGLCNELTNHPHSSKVFSFGAVTYSNEYKIKFGVDKAVVDKFTVYSEETSKEMSRAILDYTGSSFGIGITGKLKRVDEKNKFGDDSTVFISVYDGKNYYTKKVVVKYDVRQDNKNQVIDEVVDLILSLLQD